MQAILAYDWPGNVRELRTAIEHGVVMATGPRITLRDLPANVRQAAGGKSRGIHPPTSGAALQPPRHRAARSSSAPSPKATATSPKPRKNWASAAAPSTAS